MADIVNLGDKLKAQQEKTARMDLTAKMIPIMVETVEKFYSVGATPESHAFCRSPSRKLTTGRAKLRD